MFWGYQHVPGRRCPVGSCDGDHFSEAYALVEITRSVVPHRCPSDNDLTATREWIVYGFAYEFATQRSTSPHPHVHFARGRDPVVIGHHGSYVVRVLPGTDNPLDVNAWGVPHALPTKPLQFRLRGRPYLPIDIAHGSNPAARACRHTPTKAASTNQRFHPNATSRLATANSAPTHHSVSPRRSITRLRL